jgi:hypothetical protein
VQAEALLTETTKAHAHVMKHIKEIVLASIHVRSKRCVDVAMWA